MTVIFPKCQSGKYARSGIPCFIPAIFFTPYIVIAYLIRWGADKSLARPTSQCRRTESIMSLERGVCSCAELQVFSCYRGWKEARQATRAISTTWRRELSSSFFFLQGKAPEEIHAMLKEALGEHAPSYATVKSWVAQFKRGDFSTCVASRPGRPKTRLLIKVMS